MTRTGQRMIPAGALALALAAAGCHDAPTSPMSGSGVPVTLRMNTTQLPPPEGAPAPTISAAGDSVVAVAVGNVSGCNAYGATASTSSGRLVLAITVTETGGVCAAVLQFATFRVTARPVPSGRYDVVFVRRAVPRAGAATETQLARQAVALP